MNTSSGAVRSHQFRPKFGNILSDAITSKQHTRNGVVHEQAAVVCQLLINLQDNVR